MLRNESNGALEVARKRIGRLIVSIRHVASVKRN